MADVRLFVALVQAPALYRPAPHQVRLPTAIAGRIPLGPVVFAVVVQRIGAILVQ